MNMPGGVNFNVSQAAVESRATKPKPRALPIFDEPPSKSFATLFGTLPARRVKVNDSGMLHPMLKLYGDARSGNTRKVRWALEELGRPYELHTVVLAKGEHKQPEFLKLNPNGKVPVIDDDGFL